ncbi:MAG: glycosyltransferase family 4 protein [Colwellia sp.]|nr:glycosyltransferase family 4 protein [Colwellia sp.]
MKEVTIVQHRLLHYRVELFQYIKAFLEKEDIKLNLVHGQASDFEAKRKDEAILSWAIKIQNTFKRIGGVDLIWQPLPKEVDECDLLILMQENRIISNYSKIIKRKILGKKVGYWGHGKNLQSTKPNGLKELWKKKWLTSVDWWFAYTTSTVDYLINQEFSKNNITCLNNAIDVNAFKGELASITIEQIEDVRDELEIPSDANVGIFCGSLYAEKRLDLMLDAIDLVKSKVNDFYVIVIGDGPDAKFLHDAALTRPWLTLVGVKKGMEKALYYRLATIMLNPGLVGLHILDSFCAGVPMITTSDALHSPEYDYLDNGTNGLVTEGTSLAYSDAIIGLLSNGTNLKKMKEAALLDSEKYTVEAMARNFTQGIVAALEVEKA